MKKRVSVDCTRFDGLITTTEHLKKLDINHIYIMPPENSFFGGICFLII